ncbi:Abortive infection protein [Candidatus Koribacter versatilis Ellin345]|uniref:Abortive infection protein n=1 Tax=Koribacter versatilis (strain Ellin345) TaxID=204669 RepID=Q1IQA6_KORVE|nr:CPBP family intramembrane glutamic endopeptidase [Candidatus Koribacter versatilis]ABF40944.1 Abortive infection protein [Candidatus Koribacter versatilis Ellin345]
MSTSTFGFTSQPAEASQTEAPGAAAHSKVRWLELGLVLLVTILPSIVSSVFTLHVGKPIEGVSSARYVLGWLHQAGGLCLLGYVLHRSGRGFQSIGLHFAVRGVGVGLLVLLWAYLLNVVVRISISPVIKSLAGIGFAHRDMSGLFTIASPGILVIYLLVNAWYEELIARAYFMTELTALTGSAWLAVVLSTIVQASYHLYQGWYNAFSVGLIFFAYSLYYAKTRNIFPVIVAHTLQDLVAGLIYWHRLHR